MQLGRFMICLDTTFLIDYWRNSHQAEHATRQFILVNDGEEMVVPVPAAGEFLEGAAFVSLERLKGAAGFIRCFEIGKLDFDTAIHFAGIIAQLRHENALAGQSKFDLWIASWAVQHGARLATRNVKHFKMVPGLRLIAY